MKKSLIYTLLILISYQINGMDKAVPTAKKSAQDIVQKMRNYTESAAQRSDEFIRANPPAKKNALTREDVSDLFFLACKSKKPDLLNKLKAEVEIELCQIRCRTSKITLLHEAALYGNYYVVKFLVESGNCKTLIDNQENTIGATPAMMAAVKGHVPVLLYLMDQKANLYLQDKSQRTIGHYASWELPVIKLLQQKALPTLLMPDKEGNIPLNWAQKSKSIDVQKYLETLSDHKKTLTQDFDEIHTASISIQP